MDSATADLVPSSQPLRQGGRRSFQPRFDVRELGATYELKGELPGLEQKDLEIEFLEGGTLVIRGRTASESTTTNFEADAAAPEETKAVAAEETATSDTASEKSANYQKPSVEEEEGYVDAGAESSAEGAEGAKTPASASPATAIAESAAENKKVAAAEEPSYKYWISERSVGEFERRFSFPRRVDQDAVRASLKNGILSVVVPKIVGREGRRIVVE